MGLFFSLWKCAHTLSKLEHPIGNMRGDMGEKALMPRFPSPSCEKVKNKPFQGHFLDVCTLSSSLSILPPCLDTFDVVWTFDDQFYLLRTCFAKLYLNHTYKITITLRQVVSDNTNNGCTNRQYAQNEHIGLKGLKLNLTL